MLNSLLFLERLYKYKTDCKKFKSGIIFVIYFKGSVDVK